MKTKLLTVCGTIAPLMYLGIVTLGGALRADYSHVANAISELIQRGAPNKTLLDGLFCIYNLMVAGFGVALYQAARRLADGKGARSGRISGIALVVTAITGLAMTLFFPMDPRGTPATFPGVMHLVTAGITSLGSMLTIGFAAAWLGRDPGSRKYGTFSLVMLAIVFVSGGTGAYFAGTAHPLMGLVERITIGTFLAWMLVASRILPQGDEKEISDLAAARQAQAS